MGNNRIIIDKNDNPKNLVKKEIEAEISKRNAVDVKYRNRVIQVSFDSVTKILDQISLRDIEEIISSSVFKEYDISPEKITVHTDNGNKTIFIVEIPKGY
ncbi:MAG: hypothetical protein KAI57_00665 [Candidatus Pacebacteria bacterium]|nr:hypothetical protein [Candidatus Paceibacterota bacterium]